MTREGAWELLREYNKDEFHLEHAEIVGKTMRYFAEKLGYGDEADFWEVVGILHDLDFEMYPQEHCIKSQEIMRERGVDERIIHATASHGYAITVDIRPELRWRRCCMPWMSLQVLSVLWLSCVRLRACRTWSLNQSGKNIRARALRRVVQEK